MLNAGGGCRITENPRKAFGSEPWLVKLGDHVSISADVRFLTHEGALWCVRGMDPDSANADFFSPITVGNNVFIGVHSLIMPGVSIGDNVIVGAHSVVTKDIPSNVVVAGVPARQISSIGGFIEKISKKEVVPTKYMKQEEKKKYLQKIHLEWF